MRFSRYQRFFFSQMQDIIAHHVVYQFSIWQWCMFSFRLNGVAKICMNFARLDFRCRSCRTEAIYKILIHDFLIISVLFHCYFEHAELRSDSLINSLFFSSYLLLNIVVVIFSTLYIILDIR